MHTAAIIMTQRFDT